MFHFNYFLRDSHNVVPSFLSVLFLSFASLSDKVFGVLSGNVMNGLDI